MSQAHDTSIRHKAFTYRTAVTWKGADGGVLEGEGKPPVTVCTHGVDKAGGGTWCSQELFVAAVELCHMVTFLSFAAKRGIAILSYRSHANGVLEHVDGEYRFTRIVIFPTVRIGATVSEGAVHEMFLETQKHCIVANSIASIIEMSPTIIVEQS